jgi:hypothetical protein
MVALLKNLPRAAHQSHPHGVISRGFLSSPATKSAQIDVHMLDQGYKTSSCRNYDVPVEVIEKKQVRMKFETICWGAAA